MIALNVDSYAAAQTMLRNTRKKSMNGRLSAPRRYASTGGEAIVGRAPPVCIVTLANNKKILQKSQTITPPRGFQPAGMERPVSGCSKEYAASSIRGWEFRSRGLVKTDGRRQGARTAVRAKAYPTETKPNPTGKMAELPADLTEDAKITQLQFLTLGAGFSCFSKEEKHCVWKKHKPKEELNGSNPTKNNKVTKKVDFIEISFFILYFNLAICFDHQNSNY